MNNKWHVWYLDYVKKNPDSFSVLWYCITTLRWDWCIYDRVLHSYLSAFVITAPIAVAIWITTLLSYWHHSPYSVQACFFIFWLRFLMNEYICNDIGLYIKEGLFLYCWLLCFCALGADCQFVVQCSNLVIICCS